LTGLPALHAAYTRCAAFAESVAERGDIAAHVSEFWSEILGERRNYPTFDEMLVMRRGFTYPIADRGKSEDRDADRAYAEAAWNVVRQTTDREYFDRWQESSLGAPFSYSFDGLQLTPGGIVNALTSARIVEHCRRSGLGSRPLRVLEIGAGYGQVAHQLLQQLDIATYAVCDLPENAFLTSFYLQGNWPARTAAFVAAEGDRSDAGLVFTVPPLLGELEGPWDLIINSYSFQEMNRESVDAYLAHAAATLGHDGLLYSLNAHGKGLTGIRQPSDYVMEGLEIATIAPVRRYPWQMFATVPYELIMRRGSARPAASHLDGLGRAMQLGLHDEIAGLCAAFGTGTEDARLDALARFGDEREPEDARAAAAAAAGGPGGDHLAATLACATGDGGAEDALRESLPGLPGTHAEVRARVALAAFGEDADTSRALELAPHLERDINHYSSEPETLRAVLASQLGLAVEAPAPAPAGRARLAALGRSLGKRQSR
jgi:putative sugar O-methyltransferase